MTYIENLHNKIKIKYGFSKYKASQRNNYYGIDIFDEQGKCLRDYKTGLTKKETCFVLESILEG